MHVCAVLVYKYVYVLAEGALQSDAQARVLLVCACCLLKVQFYAHLLGASEGPGRGASNFIGIYQLRAHCPLPNNVSKCIINISWRASRQFAVTGHARC